MLGNNDPNLRPYVIKEDEWNRLAEIAELLKVRFNFFLKKIIFIIIKSIFFLSILIKLQNKYVGKIIQHSHMQFPFIIYY
jgi:hypothetical protein